MSCWGIFCDPQKGSKSKGKVCNNVPSPGAVSRACHVPILYSVQKRLLQLCIADEPSWKGCRPCWNNPAAAGKILSHLRLPTGVAVPERQQRNLPQSQDHSSCHEEVWPVGRDSPPQKVAADGSVITQIWKSAQPELPCRSTELQIGDRHLLYPDKTGVYCIFSWSGTCTTIVV